MKIFTLTFFVSIFVVTPAYLLNYQVLPALDNLQESYSNMDQTAGRIANTN